MVSLSVVSNWAFCFEVQSYWYLGHGECCLARTWHLTKRKTSRRSFPPGLSWRILSSSYTASSMKSSLLSCSPIFYLWLILGLQLEETRAREPVCRGALGGENPRNDLCTSREHSTPHLTVRMPGWQMPASAPSLCGLWRAELRSSYLTGKCHLAVSTAETPISPKQQQKRSPMG